MRPEQEEYPPLPRAAAAQAAINAPADDAGIETEGPAEEAEYVPSTPEKEA